MKKLCCVISCVFVIMASDAQYKYDNILYATVDVPELCGVLEQNPGYVFLDVRSKGEHDDTSFSVSLNIGRLKGAKNIAVQELATRISEIKEFRDRPIFIYCSHSQRSRRASKMLADSGFTRVFNINGGMTALHASEDDCTHQLMESSKSYSVVSAAEVCDLIRNKGNEIFLLDVRSDSAWNHISRFERDNAIGSLKGATHIARRDIAINLAQIPKDKHIIIMDIGGAEPAFAAVLLNKLGYEKVSVMLEGIDRFLLTDEKELSCKKDLYTGKINYELMNVFEFGRLAKDNKDLVLLDVRSADEFANKHKDEFRNIGRLVNAINIPHTEIKQREGELAPYKNKKIIVYAFSGGQESYSVAKQLAESGYKNVIVLMGGIFSVRWTAANRKDQGYLASFVKDVPDVNK